MPHLHPLQSIHVSRPRATSCPTQPQCQHQGLAGQYGGVAVLKGKRFICITCSWACLFLWRPLQTPGFFKIASMHRTFMQTRVTFDTRREHMIVLRRPIFKSLLACCRETTSQLPGYTIAANHQILRTGRATLTRSPSLMRARQAIRGRPFISTVHRNYI